MDYEIFSIASKKVYMDLSFNSDDELDLIKAIESISDSANNSDQKPNAVKPNEIKKEENIIQTNNNNLKSENQKTPRKKRRTPTKRNLTPKLDLDALLGPSESIQNNENNDFLNFSPKNESVFSPKDSIQTSNSSLSLLESRIESYANEAFQKLKEDITFELKILLEDDFHTQNIIYTFLTSLLSDIRNQIRFTNESNDFSQLELNFNLDINSLNLRSNSMKNNFQIHPIIEQISELKSNLTQNIKKSLLNLNQEIQSRDNELVSNRQNKNAKKYYIEQLNQKDIQLQKKLHELNFTLELYEKYNASFRRKLEDLEISEIINQQKIDSKISIQQNIEQLKDDMERSNINQENKRLLVKMKQIIDEKKDLQQTSIALNSNFKSFNELLRTNLYNISNYNNHINQTSQNFSIQFTPRPDSSILSSTNRSTLYSNEQKYNAPNKNNFVDNKSDFIYTQSDLPNMLDTMRYNVKIPNYI